MNLDVLNTEIQEFIDANIKSDISSLLLKGIPLNYINSKVIIEQIEAKKRCQKKLPTWFNTENIFYPNKLNIEQTSSEITAKYKANLVSGQTLIDLTGGFGVDAYYFSKQIENVTHCEINPELSEIVTHNYKALNAFNITCKNDSGIDVLKQLDQPFDWIYIDPSRRDDSKQKVFLLSDCTPNIKTFQNLFLKYAKHVMIKTSPLLDLTATLSDLKQVKEIHTVAVNNEVKELLWLLERDYEGEVLVKTVNLQKENTQNFQFNFKNESTAHVEHSAPLTYLYEPNSSILKAGAFNSVSQKLKVNKLHKHSHLYTSETLIDFPGRRFKIEKQLAFNKKEFAKEKITKANITTRNFPLSVNDIRKKLKVKDGGHLYLFFTININNEKIILVCSKL
ncbi:RsmD family RNA methyltransferase [Winogradskyella echinorum]|uniref:RsmD family RNA methyltransferase n=1 Tax=Winogradskyella echinorum TaxID=538189 RepID=A0ABR6Y1A1_9FLAO|nr:class I SAM-dependent methyltransferase [Winogradskyella echinorum]MBC3846535.1 RsmD family RNA methyltransferase [Winogradskyella echinorum]MBC5750883.1 RsmD family RNA methyltransferase [Winogradskyella echinorum]